MCTTVLALFFGLCLRVYTIVWFTVYFAGMIFALHIFNKKPMGPFPVRLNTSSF